VHAQNGHDAKNVIELLAKLMSIRAWILARNDHHKNISVQQFKHDGSFIIPFCPDFSKARLLCNF
jgi:hypothetical protein